MVSAKIDGKDRILHLVQPNATLRGNTSFLLVNDAVNYAIAKGYEELRLLLPMIRRAQETFRKEIDMDEG